MIEPAERMLETVHEREVGADTDVGECRRGGEPEKDRE
jgi:hypothetical protein